MYTYYVTIVLDPFYTKKEKHRYSPLSHLLSSLLSSLSSPISISLSLYATQAKSECNASGFEGYGILLLFLFHAKYYYVYT